MALFLEAIKFNHDPTSATNDAINIRRNETLFVNVPEWCSGVSANPEDSPAAYALCETRGNPLTIQAKFRCTDPNVVAIEVRAMDARINLPFLESGVLGLVAWLARPLLRRIVKNVLGEIKEKYIFPCEGETDFETFELKNVRIWEQGVSVNDIAWRWQYRLNRDSPWVDFEISKHRIYTILRVPKRPWRQEPYVNTNTQLPWSEVLDYACNWASSARLVDDAATRITQGVNNLGPSVVRFRSGSHYITGVWGNFDCTAFLRRLRGGADTSSFVNCTDCATIVSTFANTLGCDLWQSRMSGFTYNPIKKIGESKWSTDAFDFHTVAWEGECDEGNDVYDACLKVDGDEDPANSPSMPVLPTNLRFGKHSDRQYRFRLVAPSNPNAAQPEPHKRRRRAVGGDRRIEDVKFVDKDLLKILRQRHNFVSWRGLKLLEENLFISNFIPNKNSLAGWTLHDVEVAEIEDLPGGIKTLWRPADDDSQLLLRIDFFECASLSGAHDFLLQLLTEFEEPALTRREQPVDEEGDLGDIFFASPDETTIIFARANMVLMLRNIQLKEVPLTKVARQLDQSIISRPTIENGKIGGEMNRFDFVASEPYQSKSKHLFVKPPDPLEGLRLTHKFFSQTGEIFSQSGKWIYQPSESDHNKIEIFAVNENGSALKQELEFPEE